MNFSVMLSILAALVLTGGPSGAARPSVLIIDGENHHHQWRETTPVLKGILEPYFDVSVATVIKDQPFKPDFSGYDAVLSNYNGEPWPPETRKRFEDFVREGGGFVSVHAANNAFPDWPEYNRMIGLGGWKGRTEKHGPYLRVRREGIVRDKSPGPAGSHGVQHEFLTVARQPHHPILEGMPSWWMHARDELYDRLRGPAEQLDVLATAYSQASAGGTGEHEPLLMAIAFGKGRVFHTVLGHSTVAMRGLGFQITLQRGTEWAATGEVTIPATDGEYLNDKYAAYRDHARGEPGVWLSLFNGHSLKGWVQRNGYASYEVEKGAILGRTDEGSPNSFLCTREDFSDFELKFEVMVNDLLNSGVQIRSQSRADYRDGRVHGPQVEISAAPEGSAGYIFSEGTERGWLSQSRPLQGLFKGGDWNHYHVKVQGARIQTWVNGARVADLTDEESFRSGFIGLQVHGIPAGSGPYEVRWKTLLLRRLDRH